MTEPRYFGVILAGGLSRRMGGGLKSLQAFDDQTLLSFITSRIRPQVEALALNVNDEDPALGTLGLPLIADQVSGRVGPLAGIHAAMLWAGQAGAGPQDFVVTLAADTPFFPAHLVDKLKREALDHEVVMARTSLGPHPTFAAWQVGLADKLLGELEAGCRKIRRFAEAQAFAWADFPLERGRGEEDFDPFFNINWPDELEEAKAVLAEKRARGEF